MPIFTLALAASLAAIAVAAPVQADPVPSHRWRSRLLVVVAPERDALVVEQQRLYEAARSGARERDLILVQGVGRSADAESLRRRFGVGPSEFRAILVGKDGEAKLSSAEPIAAERLFDLIDTMPMRRDEMRRGTRS